MVRFVRVFYLLVPRILEKVQHKRDGFTRDLSLSSLIELYTTAFICHLKYKGLFYYLLVKEAALFSAKAFIPSF